MYRSDSLSVRPVRDVAFRDASSSTSLAFLSASKPSPGCDSQFGREMERDMHALIAKRKFFLQRWGVGLCPKVSALLIGYAERHDSC